MAEADPRAVANTIIEFANEFDIPVTNLALQKVLYFIQARHIQQFDEPIMSGNFEAWPYGPVHPLVYDSFKDSGKNSIDFFAKSFDFLEGASSIVEPIAEKSLRLFVRETANAFLKMSPGRLVDLSHAKDSPWDIASRSGAKRAYGRRISNDLIRSNFRHHLAPIDDEPRIGEPDEETPPSRN